MTGVQTCALPICCVRMRRIEPVPLLPLPPLSPHQPYPSSSSPTHNPPPGRQRRRQIEVLGECHVIVQLLEIMRERDKMRLSDLLEPLQVDDEHGWRRSDEVTFVRWSHYHRFWRTREFLRRWGCGLWVSNWGLGCARRGRRYIRTGRRSQLLR